jgi:hypothetical protein
MNGAGILSTQSDGVLATTGDQNTSVEYTDFLDSIPDLNLGDASFSLSGLTAVGPTTGNSPLFTQNYSGGQFSLYDPGNVLLLSGNLISSALSGVTGPSGSGVLFTTTFGNVTNGTLAGMLLPGTITVSMSLTNVNDPNGFSVNANTLAAFLSDASVTIGANPIPEPTTLTLLALMSAAGFLRRRR